MQMSPYLSFAGTCREAFAFYAELMGGEVVGMMPYGETPMSEQTPAEWRDKIMYAQLRLDGQVLMGGDSPPDMFMPAQGFMVALVVDTPEEAERLFDGLKQGGTERMPMAPTFWAERFGMVVDRFGIPWAINGSMRMG